MKPSFLGRLIEARETHKLDENEAIKSFTDNELKGAGASLYSAGQDTTYSTETVFVMGMLLNPKVQAQAQRDIEAVTGGERLPNFEDWDKLPIVERIVHESFRSARIAIISLKKS